MNGRTGGRTDGQLSVSGWVSELLTDKDKQTGTHLDLACLEHSELVVFVENNTFPFFSTFLSC